MRVLAMVPDYPPRGVGSWVMTHTMLRALVARGHAVDVVLVAPTGEPYELDGVRVWPHRDKSDPFRFIDDASVLVTHVESAGRPIALGNARGVPVVQIAHNAGAFTESALRRRAAALTVFNSQHVAAQLGSLCVRSVVIHPPVPAADYATTPGDTVTLVNLSEDKGADVFYALAERFPDRVFLGVRGGYGTQVVPAGDDDLPNVEIVDHVPPDRMRDRVYARTRVLLMPSAHESWGRVGVEAMCSGIPVIAHPTAGLRESLGEAGTFCDRDDVDAWETALRRLLDGRRWRAASRRALARAAALDPADDLDRWCSEIEALGRRRLRVRARIAG